MSYQIDIQHACQTPISVDDATLRHWIKHALTPYQPSAELTLRIVDKEEITELNSVYRKQPKATNVLAFPATYPNNIELEYPLLGDIIICPAVLQEESLDLDKSLTAHWAHIVLHGVLHLLGYDHLHTEDTNRMQSIEIRLLAELGFDNPYVERG